MRVFILTSPTSYPNVLLAKYPNMVKTVTRLIVSVRRMAETEMIYHDQLVKVWTRRNCPTLRGRVVGIRENKNILELLVRDHLTPARTQQRERERMCSAVEKVNILQ